MKVPLILCVYLLGLWCCCWEQGRYLGLLQGLVPTFMWAQILPPNAVLGWLHQRQLLQVSLSYPYREDVLCSRAFLWGRFCPMPWNHKIHPIHHLAEPLLIFLNLTILHLCLCLKSPSVLSSNDHVEDQPLSFLQKSSIPRASQLLGWQNPFALKFNSVFSQPKIQH